MANYIETIEWSPSGMYYALFGNREILVMSVQTGKIKYEYVGKSLIKSICWLNNDQLLLGQQNGCITLIKLDGTHVCCNRFFFITHNFE